MPGLPQTCEKWVNFIHVSWLVGVSSAGPAGSGLYELAGGFASAAVPAGPEITAAGLSESGIVVRPQGNQGEAMLYAVLCYHDEAEVTSWTKAQDDAFLAQRAVGMLKVDATGKLGPGARLMPTSAATTR